MTEIIIYILYIALMIMIWEIAKRAWSKIKEIYIYKQKKPIKKYNYINRSFVRGDLEQTAKLIISRKWWTVTETARILGYSRNHMHLVAAQKGFYINKIGGIKHFYAIDVLELFEEQSGIKFPELAESWRLEYDMDFISN